MKGNDVIHDEVAVRYADGIDHVWGLWEDALTQCERLLTDDLRSVEYHAGDALAALLRRAQYRAHIAAEFATGLVPPPSASDAHALLGGALAACRDVLGVLAVRAELDELDADTREIGMHSVRSTRDAFRHARSTTALVHAWVADDQVDPSWLSGTAVRRQGRTATALSLLLWVVAVTCILLVGNLAIDVMGAAATG